MQNKNNEKNEIELKNTEIELQNNNQSNLKNNINCNQDDNLISNIIYLGQTQLFNTVNKLEQKEEFKKILNENSIKVKSSIGDILNNWFKKYLEMQNQKFKSILENEINKNDKKEIANNALNQIIEAQNYISSQYKDQKIKRKKVANKMIIASCFCGIGFFLLKKRKQNKQVINDFENMSFEKNNFIKQQWEIKSNAMYDLFSNFSKTKIINEVFKESGIFIQDYASVPGLLPALKTVITNAIGYLDVFALNIGKKVIYFTNYCKEWFEVITTSASVTVPYTDVEYYTDANGNRHSRIVTKYETVYAYHYEDTPYREIDALSIMKFDNSSPEENEISWTLKFNQISEQKNIDHLKAEKIAKNKAESIKNILNLENQEFNHYLNLNANINGTINDEKFILSWFTFGTQENLVNFKKYCDEIKINLIYYFIIRKTLNFLIVYHEKPISINWLTNSSFVDDIDYSKLSSIDNNINLLCNSFQKINNLIMSHINIYLSIAKSANDIINDQSFENYSLLNDNKMIEPFSKLDGSYLISLGVRNNVLFSTNPEKALMDNYIEESTNTFNNFTETVVRISNYFVTKEYDFVTEYAYCANQYVTIRVPYNKFHKYYENAIIISINKKNIEEFETKLDKYTKYLKCLEIVFYGIYDTDRVNLFFNNITQNTALHNEIFLYAETMFNKK